MLNIYVFKNDSIIYISKNLSSQTSIFKTERTALCPVAQELVPVFPQHFPEPPVSPQVLVQPPVLPLSGARFGVGICVLLIGLGDAIVAGDGVGVGVVHTPLEVYVNDGVLLIVVVVVIVATQ